MTSPYIFIFLLQNRKAVRKMTAFRFFCILSLPVPVCRHCLVQLFPKVSLMQKENKKTGAIPPIRYRSCSPRLWGIFFNVRKPLPSRQKSPSGHLFPLLRKGQVPMCTHLPCGVPPIHGLVRRSFAQLSALFARYSVRLCSNAGVHHSTYPS